MVVDLKEFLSRGPRVTIPSQFNAPVLTDVSQELRFTYDLSKQGRRIQRGESLHTMVAAVVPTWTFPVVPRDEIHVYHFLGVTNDTTPGTRVFIVRSQYPQFNFAQEERFQVGDGQMLNMLSVASSGSSQSRRGGRALQIFPEGILSVSQSGNAAIADELTLGFLREVVGGAAIVEQVSNIVTTSEQ